MLEPNDFLMLVFILWTIVISTIGLIIYLIHK